MQSRWMILASVACGTFMATLDSSIVNVALPSITQWFHTGLANSRWVVISYLFSITGLLLFFGKLADTIGRKGVFNAGFLIFTLGSLLCGTSHTIDQLIFFRAFQGLGASMLMANGPAIITFAFPANERGRALGILAMVVSLGLAIGPSFGGLLLKLFGWPSIFFVNLPFGLLGAAFVFKYLPNERPHKGFVLTKAEFLHREQRLPFLIRLQNNLNKLRYFDWLGAILWMCIQLGYSISIDQGNNLGISDAMQKLIAIGTFALFSLFLIWESSIDDPVLKLAVFKSRTFRFGNIAGFFAIIGLSTTTLLMPFYLQNIRRLDTVFVGLIMTAIPAANFICAPIAGRLSDIYGSKFFSIFGMTLISCGLILLGIDWNADVLGISLHQKTHVIVFHLALIGAGFGLFQAPNSRAIMNDVAAPNLGTASALLATVRNFGLVTGTAISSAFLMNFYTKLAIHRPEDSSSNFIISLKYTFYVVGLICAIGIPASIYSTKFRSGHGKKGH